MSAFFVPLDIMNEERLIKLTVNTSDSGVWNLVISRRLAELFRDEWIKGVDSKISVTARLSDIDANKIEATWDSEAITAIDIIEINQAL